LHFSGIRSQYEPFDSIHVAVENPQAAGSTISLAVRDASTSEYLYDSSNILTEMLLCSQIRGFVEQPDYYFEKDDETHRRHLDLLLMVQGWRRHNWITMATPGIFRVNHPYEKTPVYFGAVYRYIAIGHEGFDGWGNMIDQEIKHYDFSRPEGGEWFSHSKLRKPQGMIPLLGNAGEARDKHNAYSYLLKDNESATFDGRNYYDEGNLHREVRVHAEYHKPTDVGVESVYGELTTKNGRFVLEFPGFYNRCTLDLSASDTTKWKEPLTTTRKGRRLLRKRDKLMSKGKAVPSLEHQWVKPTETDYPEFYVRLTPYHPRFCKPFSFYHIHVAPPREGTALMPNLRDGHTLATVTVRSKHGGLRSYDSSHPAVTRDAYQIFNECVDAGFTPGWFAGKNSFSKWVERLLVGDMNMYRQYQRYQNAVEDSRGGWHSYATSNPMPSFPFLGPAEYGPAEGNNNETSIQWANYAGTRYNPNLEWSTSNQNAFSFTGLDDKTKSLDYLYSLRSVNLITDYAPRMEGSPRYSGANQPTVDVGFNLITDKRRETFRDRHFVLQGFDVGLEFYSPNYQRRPLPDTKDYRRTLYWNPNLKLDKHGRADIKLWNNSNSTCITVSAEGITPNGKVLTGISYPEDR
jgi:hypothetical protein